MKTLRLILILLFASTVQYGIGQITAGEIGFNTTILYPEIGLANPDFNTTVSDTVDINCDGQNDLEFLLHKDQTSVDGINTFAVRVLNDNIEFCMNGTGFSGRPKFYSFGETLNCGLGFSWVNDTLLYIGSYGGFTPIPPAAIDERYLGYRFYGGTDDEALGWIFFSYNLDDSGEFSQTITASIEEILIQCPVQSIDEYSETANIQIYPNPSTDNIFHINSSAKVENYILYTILGTEVEISWINSNTFSIAEDVGIYILEVQYSDGQKIRKRIVKK